MSESDVVDGSVLGVASGAVDESGVVDGSGVVDDGPSGDAPVRWCPSGDPDRPESVVLGVRSGPDRQVVYLAEPIPAAQVLGDIPAGVPPTRVLRFASHCVSECANRSGDCCTLIERITAASPAAPDADRALPRCHLRPDCKWWHQAGPDACRRCPLVATLVAPDDELMALVADPATTVEQVRDRDRPRGRV